MKEYFYKTIHLPDGQTFIRSQEFVSLEKYFQILRRWNDSNPSKWLYAPIDKPFDIRD
jgi:hypothetical protein